MVAWSIEENSCYSLEWGIIKIENGEMSIYGKHWKHSLDQVNVGNWNWYYSMYFIYVWDYIANITHYHSQDSNSVLFGDCKD